MSIPALALAYAGLLTCVGVCALKAMTANPELDNSRYAAGFALGAGGTSIALFWLSLLSIRPGRAVVAGLLCVTLTALYLASRRMSSSTPAARPWSGCFHAGLRKFPIFFTALLPGLALVTWHAVGTPLFEGDAVAIWGLKAKVVYEQPVRSAAYFHEIEKSYSHLDYPLGAPFLTAGLYGLFGGVDDRWGKSVWPFVYLAFLCLCHSGFRAYVEREIAAGLTVVASLTPALLRWAGSGLADVLLAMYLAASLIHALRWIEQGIRRDLVLSAVFAAFSVFTKNEGLPIALSLACALGFSAPPGRRREAPGIFLGTTALISIPWFLFLVHLPQTHENYWSKIALGSGPALFARLGAILAALMREALRFREWGGIWILLGTLAFLGQGAFQSRAMRFLWIAISLHLAAYVWAYGVTPWDVAELIEVSLSRICLHLLPAGLLLIAIHLGAFQRYRHSRT